MAVLQTHNGYHLWNYIPSMPAGIVFAILFFVMTGFHFKLLFNTHSKIFWPFAIGCLMEAIGYCARVAAVNNTGLLITYIIPSLFILVAPALFAATIYMTLGMIIRSLQGERLSAIRVNWLTRIFILGDVISFILQASSSGLMFNPQRRNIGEAIVVVGLFIQMISFALFFIIAVIFQARMNKFPTRASCNLDSPWQKTLYMLYGISTLILIRSLFRIVEYLEGYNGYSLSHEWTLYVFDSTPMFLVTVLLYYQHPSKLAEPPTSDEESVDIQLCMPIDITDQPKSRN